MQIKTSKPEDLAKYVFRNLNGTKTSVAIPPLRILIKLFEYLFYTSLKTEESNLLKVTITIINPKNPDPTPPKRIVADRWQFIEFESPIPYTIESLVKLSKAADPWSSSLAVYYDEKHNLSIWGMIDQSVHYQSFLNYEADSGPEQPGLFQASITGIGSIAVLFDYEPLASLKQNKLITKYIDVLRFGPISNILSGFFDQYKIKINDYLANEIEDALDIDWSDWVDVIFRESISRILLRIQNYHHGGAILFTSNVADDINIKYKAEYSRIPSAIIALVKHTIDNYYSQSTIFDRMHKNNKTIPVSLYLTNSVSENDKEETTNELKGALRFVASQTCVDGLVLFDDRFVAKGFGTVLKTQELPPVIYISSTAIASDKSLTPSDTNHFGTRHRSMFSYCWQHNGSVGFVVSQDGDIRAVTRVNDKLIVWDNIKAQQFLRSRKIRHFPSKNKINE